MSLLRISKRAAFSAPARLRPQRIPRPGAYFIRDSSTLTQYSKVTSVDPPPQVGRRTSLRQIRRMATIPKNGAPETPSIQHFYDPPTGSFQYIVADEASHDAVIIDPVLDFDPSTNAISTFNADRILAFVGEKNYRVVMILETHVHADHMTAASYLQRRLETSQGIDRPLIGIGMRVKKIQDHFAARYNVPAPEYENAFDKLFEDDEDFCVSNLQARAVHVPGHTPDHMGYVIGDNIFVGDSLLHVDLGSARADFPGGDAVTLFKSGHKVLQLPDHFRVWSGHDYPHEHRSEPECSATVQEHRELNKHFNPSIKEDDFVHMRQQRDATLSEPRLMHPSLQVNIRAGKLPAPDASGNRFIHLPLKIPNSDMR